MSAKLENLIRGILEESGFLLSVRSVKEGPRGSRLFKDGVRHLKGKEVDLLKSQGNTADDWDRVMVAEGFSPGGVFRSRFIGACSLGVFDGRPRAIDASISLPPGICNTTVIDSEIGNNCVLFDAGIISNYLVAENAVIMQTASVSASGSCAFGNGIEIVVGNETGGREILSYADMTIQVAEAVAKSRGDRAFLDAYAKFIERYVDACRAPFGYVGRGSVIRNTKTVQDSYIGDNVVIVGANLVRNSTVLGTADEQTEISHGAYVSDSCVQWGSSVTSMAIVDKSILCEHSHAERHGKVTLSIVGPNSGVAEGECTSSLLGPFVGFHHQAMLIAGVWPEGKGNIAYGANIGSNHTSKAPDQEIWCGEGLFFGLGVNVKFPSDFTRAPYSIIATGVDTLPQRLEFPFSLINKPAVQPVGVPVSYNEIFPAWVLYENIYSVRRNEGKYKKRNKARRSDFVFTVFRPEIVDLMVAARNRLQGVSVKKDAYTEEDIPGLGKNYLLEENRTAAIDAYGLYLEYYALNDLLRELSRRGKKERLEGSGKVYEEGAGSPELNHARRLLVSEGYARRTVSENLERLAALLETVARKTQQSKEKDDVRGRRIISDYDEVTKKANDDSFIKDSWAEAERIRNEIKVIVERL